MSKDKEIRELFARHKVELDRDDIWAVQGTPVVKHKALERLGAAMQLAWDKPQVLLAERDAAAVLVSGTAANGYEWSIGEAVIGQNYKVSPKVAAYPYAMAEKRGKDRVILKLAGLQGVYSEEEADDFKSRDPEPSNAGERPVPENTAAAIFVQETIALFKQQTDLEKHRNWFRDHKAILDDFDIMPGTLRYQLLRSAWEETGKQLASKKVIAA